MARWQQIRLSVVFFWLILLTLLAFIWPLLPTTFAQALTLVVIGLGLWLLRFQKSDLLLLLTLALMLWAVNDWANTGVLGNFALTLLVFISVTVVGLSVESVSQQPYFAPENRITYWLILAFLTTQTITLLLFLPLSASGRAILTLIIFYFLWELLRHDNGLSRRFIVSHLLFVFITVTLVVGVMIWNGFPQLGIF